MSIEYWVWLQQVLGYGSAKLPYIYKCFDSVKQLYEASEEIKIKSKLFSNNEINKINKISMKYVNSIIEKCNKLGYDIISPDDELYPERLLNIADPPVVLYSSGKFPPLDGEVVISIVGPRQPTEYGRKAALSLSARLAKAGVIIVSGGAVGIDSYSHKGTLVVNGKTIAVLGCGLNYPYLSVNADLREKIAASCAVISEFPPDYPPSKYTFPIRNRIISGVSLGTAIIEAGIKSGSLITARHAVEQGRDVFVIPGNPSFPEYEGSNLLIKDGAKPLLSAMDILEEYINSYPHKLNLRCAFDLNDNETAREITRTLKDNKPTNTIKKNKKVKKAQINESVPPHKKSVDLSDLSESAKLVYNNCNTPKFQPDEMSFSCGLNSGDLLAALTELELFGFIKAIPGGRFELIK